MTNRLAKILLALLVAACHPAMLPGTDIKDTPEKRAIYNVIEAYVKAMNGRDANAVLALVASDYFDDAGTPEPNDDLDRAGLEKVLVDSFAKLDATKLAVAIRRIEVEGEADAWAEIFYDNWYRVQTNAGPKPRRDSDVHKMKFKKVNGEWKITSGV